jgi:hypothetical protein
MHMRYRQRRGRRAALFLVSTGLLSTFACSTSSHVFREFDAGRTCPPSTGAVCRKTTSLADDDYADCSSCKFSATASPSTCTTNRSVDACCAWVQEPAAVLARAVGLHEYSATTDPTPDWSCLGISPTGGDSGTPGEGGGSVEAGTDALGSSDADAGLSPDAGSGSDGGGDGGSEGGASETATLSGYVKILASLPSSAGTVGVNVQVFGVNPATGVLDTTPIGAVTTSAAGASETNTWLEACGSGCRFFRYQIPAVPIGKPLVLETSDATGAGVWSTLYEYNVYFPGGSTCEVDGGGPCVHYDATAVTPADIEAIAQPAGLDPLTGVIVGEVHDCGDVRIAGANVDTDQPHAASMVYFGNTEANPLPDPSRTAEDLGTNALGRFAAFSFATGVPIRISAIGDRADCQDTLIGTNVVQAYPASMTWITLRGRAPYQAATSP